jgi:hypothetical protein
VRIGVVIPTIWNADSFTTDPRILVDGFAQLDHEAVIFCSTGSELPHGAPAIAADRRELGDIGFWRAQGLDGAVVFTWLNAHSDVVTALSRAGVFVVSKGDSDGLCGPRIYPGPTLRRALHSSNDTVSTARNVWIWTKRIMLRGEHTAFAEPIVKMIEQAGATIVETEAARDNLARFLRHMGATNLIERVHFVPNPAADAFVSVSVSQPRERLIFAVGRWDSTQKDGRLMSNVLRRYLGDDTEARIVLAGTGKIALPAERVDQIGQVTREKLAAIAARARVCLITSQWEGSHIAGHEALAAGAAIVGTPIPAVKSMTNAGRSGTMASRHRTSSVVDALTAEMRAWDDGLRSPVQIAEHWRACLRPDAVADAMIRLMPTIGSTI